MVAITTTGRFEYARKLRRLCIQSIKSRSACHDNYAVIKRTSLSIYSRANTALEPLRRAALFGACGIQLLFDDWRGYLVAGFSLIWVANFYMILFGRIRLDIKRERIEMSQAARDCTAVIAF